MKSKSEKKILEITLHLENAYEWKNMSKIFEISYNHKFPRIMEGGMSFLIKHLISQANYHFGRDDWYATKFWTQENDDKVVLLMETTRIK